MRIYGIIGESTQTIVDSATYQPSANEVLMQTERPTEGYWLATEDGTWVKQEPAPAPPTMEERMEVLESDNEYLKAENETLNDTMLGIIDMIDTMQSV